MYTYTQKIYRDDKLIVVAKLSSDAVIDVLAAELMEGSLQSATASEDKAKPKYTSKITKKETKRSKPRCKKCGQPGHMAKTCKDTVKGEVTDTDDKLSADQHLRVKRMVEGGVSLHELLTAFPDIDDATLSDMYDRYNATEM